MGDIPDDELVTILQHRCSVRGPGVLVAPAVGAPREGREENDSFPQMIDADLSKAASFAACYTLASFA